MIDVQHELLKFWLQGNEDAVRLCEDVGEWSQTLDDLYDRDRPVTGEQVQRMAMLMLSVVPRNPFYRQHRDTLEPFIETALMYWIDSTTLEVGSRADRQIAFVFRDIVGGIVNKCALLVGGLDWWSTVSADIHRRFMDEDIESFVRGE